MENRDKAWELFNGKPLVLHVINALASSVDDIIISSSRDHPGYSDLPYTRIEDTQGGFLGPLSGIASTVPHVTSPLALVVPCDIPNLPNNIVEVLRNQLGDHDACVAHDGDRLQQLVFVARTACLASIAPYLEAGHRSVMGWLDTVDYSVGSIPGTDNKFRNINRLEQLDESWETR